MTRVTLEVFNVGEENNLNRFIAVGIEPTTLCVENKCDNQLHDATIQSASSPESYARREYLKIVY